MKILINLTQDKLTRFSKATGVSFAPLGSKPDSESVAVVVAPQLDLAQAIALNIPVIAVCGSSQEYIDQAVLQGIPDACIVFKDGENTVTNDRKIIAPGKRGITVQAVIQVAQYALENNLYPELLIWEETSAGLWIL